MKITTGILGCALVAGLMTFASGNAHAKDLVISNEVYATFNLKLSTEYTDTDGKKLKKASITSKQFLADLNYDTSKVKLAFNTTTLEVWIVNKDSLISNLSSNGTLLVEFDSAQAAQPNSNKQSYKQVGLVYVFTDAEQADTFDVSGVYSESYSYSNVKNGEQTFSDSLKAKSLSGSGRFADLSANLLPISGSTDYKGSGKIVPPAE